MTFNFFPVLVTEICCDWNPTALMMSVADSDGMTKLKLPSAAVVLLIFPPFTDTVAPTIGVPLLSTTVPVTVNCKAGLKASRLKKRSITPVNKYRIVFIFRTDASMTGITYSLRDF